MIYTSCIIRLYYTVLKHPLYCCNTMIYIALQLTVAGFVRASHAFYKKTHD